VSAATCPVSGCAAVLGVGPTTGAPRVICPPHWRRVPRPLQLRISGLWRLVDEPVTRGQKNGKANRSQAWTDFVAAVRAAVRYAEAPR
jgi:hypothetical protein